MRVAPGETVVRFAPAPTGTLRVSVADVRPGEHVEVRTARGERVPWIVDGPEFAERERIPSGGAVELERLYAGPLELFVGSVAELDAGKPRLRERFELRPWTTLDLAR